MNHDYSSTPNDATVSSTKCSSHSLAYIHPRYYQHFERISTPFDGVCAYNSITRIPNERTISDHDIVDNLWIYNFPLILTIANTTHLPTIPTPITNNSPCSGLCHNNSYKQLPSHQAMDGLTNNTVSLTSTAPSQ